MADSVLNQLGDNHTPKNSVMDISHSGNSNPFSPSSRDPTSVLHHFRSLTTSPTSRTQLPAIQYAGEGSNSAHLVGTPAYSIQNRSILEQSPLQNEPIFNTEIEGSVMSELPMQNFDGEMFFTGPNLRQRNLVENCQNWPMPGENSLPLRGSEDGQGNSPYNVEELEVHNLVEIRSCDGAGSGPEERDIRVYGGEIENISRPDYWASILPESEESFNCSDLQSLLEAAPEINVSTIDEILGPNRLEVTESEDEDFQTGLDIGGLDMPNIINPFLSSTPSLVLQNHSLESVLRSTSHPMTHDHDRGVSPTGIKGFCDIMNFVLNEPVDHVFQELEGMQEPSLDHEMREPEDRQEAEDRHEPEKSLPRPGTDHSHAPYAFLPTASSVLTQWAALTKCSSSNHANQSCSYPVLSSRAPSPNMATCKHPNFIMDVSPPLVGSGIAGTPSAPIHFRPSTSSEAELPPLIPVPFLSGPEPEPHPQPASSLSVSASDIPSAPPEVQSSATQNSVLPQLSGVSSAPQLKSVGCNVHLQQPPLSQTCGIEHRSDSHLPIPAPTPSVSSRFKLHSLLDEQPIYLNSSEGASTTGTLALKMVRRAALMFNRADIDQARRILKSVKSIILPKSKDFLHRVSFYFMEALQVKISGQSSPLAMKAMDSRHGMLQKMEGGKLFYEVSPIPKFAIFPANQTILEATEGEDRIHVITFEVGLGLQWSTFLEDFAARATATGKPRSVRLTAVVGCRTLEVKQTGKNLCKVAKDLKLSLDFRVVPCPVEEDLLSSLDLREGEAVAVNFVHSLHRLMMLRDSCESLSVLLQAVRDTRPKVVTVVEVEANHNHSGFCDRFGEALQYFIFLFESLNKSAKDQDSFDKIMLVEKFLLAPQILNIVSSEGDERVRRHEKLEMWRVRFATAGFHVLPMSDKSAMMAGLILPGKLTDLEASTGGFGIIKDGGSLLLSWKGWPLMAASAWTC